MLKGTNSQKSSTWWIYVVSILGRWLWELFHTHACILLLTWHACHVRRRIHAWELFHTHTHTHTYKGVIYIYTCVCVCVCVCIGVPPTGRFAPEESTVFVAARKVFCFSFFFLVALQERTVLVAASKDFYRPFSNIIYNIMYNIIHNIMYVLCFTNIIYMI